MPHFWLMDELSSCPQKYEHLLPLSEQQEHETPCDSAEFTPSKHVKRRVRFDANNARIHSIQGRELMTVRERRDKWYTKHDYDLIWEQSVAALKHASSRRGCYPTSEENADDKQEHAVRGLEHRLKKNTIRRNAIKTNAINAVLSEQERQRHEIDFRTNGAAGQSSNSDRATAIRKIYQEYNQASVADAIQQGLVDQREIKNQCDVPKRRKALIVLEGFDPEDLENEVDHPEDETERSFSDALSRISLHSIKQKRDSSTTNLDDLDESVLTFQS